ncbi:MAG: serine hydrolase domain-containing protein [Candidatus Thorarchaeota archaeon]
MRFHLRSSSTTIFFILILTLNSFFSTNFYVVSSTERDYWPTEEWKMSTAKKQKMKNNILEQMIEYVQTERINLHSVVIVRNGYIVFEEYLSPGYMEQEHYLWSVTKSFMSALYGIAFEEGYITDFDAKVLSFFPNVTIDRYDPRKENITIANLLTMTTGLLWYDDANWVPMVSAPNQVEYILGLSLINDPGTVWNYDTGGTHLLSAILQEVYGNTTLNFAEKYLFSKIGITDYSWDQDKQGIYYGGHGMYMTARDMARFGYLYLNNGTWDGEQVIPSEWVNATTSPLIPLWSGWAYGALWWIRTDLGFYSARGRYDQMIYVLPEQDIVVAMTSNNAPGSFDPDFLIENFVIPAVKDDEASYPFILISYIGLVIISILIQRRRKLK